MDLYHVLNRGVDKRDIFTDQKDYLRFVHNLYEFNDAEPALDHRLRTTPNSEFVTPKRRKRSLIVEIHGWCLMKNHFHLLLSERVEGGMTRFLRKLNIGYAMYFNERHGRSGTLFQGRTKKVLVERDAHFLHILNYIHLNPLDYLKGASAWRESSIQSHSSALSHLSGYRWSSYLDYCGQKNFPSLLTTKLFKGVFGDYRKMLTECLRDLEIDTFSPYTLE